ncbi:MAG: agmatinase [Phycisphaeraceae bacterium]|nr:agmatinase [Phycisphaeraceae bacterium]
MAKSVPTPRTGRTTVLPDARISPRYAGLVTFGRYPRLEDVAPENRPVDWVVYGAPFDSGVTYRPGARFGPRAVRMESQYLKRYSIAHGVDVCDILSLADGGDAPARPYSCEGSMQAQADFACGLGDRTSKLLALGGDHSIAYANIRATWERLGKPKRGLALLHFDSHLDTVDVVWGDKWGHASPFRRAIEDGIVDPGRMISIGIKGPLNTPADLEFARDHGVTVLTCGDVRRAGTGPVEKFVRAIGDAPCYMTFDIDVVDPAFAPGTGTPSVGGFTSAEALDLLRACRGVNVVGADVVEVLPDRDVSGITALLAAHVAFEVLCLDAAQRIGIARRIRRGGGRG